MIHMTEYIFVVFTACLSAVCLLVYFKRNKRNEQGQQTQPQTLGVRRKSLPQSNVSTPSQPSETGAATGTAPVTFYQPQTKDLDPLGGGNMLFTAPERGPDYEGEVNRTYAPPGARYDHIKPPCATPPVQSTNDPKHDHMLPPTDIDNLKK